MKFISFILPMLFFPLLITCTSEFDNPPSPEELFGGTPTNSSSSGDSGSISDENSSSSSDTSVSNPSRDQPTYPAFTCGEDAVLIDERDSKQYRYKTINGKAWMLENLNYSKGETKGWCQRAIGGIPPLPPTDQSDLASCDDYGRYYDWATAMNLPKKCNSTSDCEIETEHQGVCPKGWHVANYEDFVSLGTGITQLELVDGGNYGTNDGEGQPGYPWPTGWGNSTISILILAREGTNPNEQNYIMYDYESRNNATKTDLAPVRCVANAATMAELPTCENSSSSSVIESSSSGAGDTFIDDRDGSEYKVKDIGGAVWFIENLALNDQTTYTWNEAMSQCPDGWHLPNNEEWTNAQSVLGSTAETYFADSWWSATEDYNSSIAYLWNAYSGSLEGNGNYYKLSAHAVRCVKD